MDEKFDLALYPNAMDLVHLREIRDALDELD
jgi:hypothetical protein